MSDDHLHMKVKEALAATGNDRHDAQKLLITWAVRDPALLLAMVKPHLKAIATTLVDHASRKSSAVPSGNAPEHLSRTTIDGIIGKSSSLSSGDKRRKSTLPPPKSTERQASAMRRLAEAFTKKKDE